MHEHGAFAACRIVEGEHEVVAPVDRLRALDPAFAPAVERGADLEPVAVCLARIDIVDREAWDRARRRPLLRTLEQGAAGPQDHPLIEALVALHRQRATRPARGGRREIEGATRIRSRRNSRDQGELLAARDRHGEVGIDLLDHQKNYPRSWHYQRAGVVVGEGLVARRRSMATLVDHMVPPFKAGGLTEDLARLSERMNDHSINETKNPELAARYGREARDIAIQAVCRASGVQTRRALGCESKPEKLSCSIR